jgi:hypothetical protein
MLKVVKKGWWPLKPFLGVKRGLDWGAGLLTFAALFATARVAAGCGGLGHAHIMVQDFSQKKLSFRRKI